jgi:putative phosphoesterase
MRIAILSDIHGNHLALQAVLRLSGRADAILFAGDLCGYYPFAKECLDLLAPLTVLAVRGNHDQELLDARHGFTTPSADYQRRYGTALGRAMANLTDTDCEHMRGWPAQLDVVLGGYSFRIVHGSPWDPLHGRVYPDFDNWERFQDCKADVIVMGHTHYRLVKRRGNQLIINPGSVGQARDVSGMASCAILDLGSPEVQFIQAPYAQTALIDDARRHDPQLPYLVEVLQR